MWDLDSKRKEDHDLQMSTLLLPEDVLPLELQIANSSVFYSPAGPLHRHRQHDVPIYQTSNLSRDSGVVRVNLPPIFLAYGRQRNCQQIVDKFPNLPVHHHHYPH